MLSVPSQVPPCVVVNSVEKCSTRPVHGGAFVQVRAKVNAVCLMARSRYRTSVKT